LTIDITRNVLAMVDWKNIKKEYIPSNQVPTGRNRESPWDDVFTGIPKGQALVLREPEVNAGTIRAALKRKQAHGKYKNLKLTSKGVHGSATIYLINTESPVVRFAHKVDKGERTITENI
jgi:hypothetical protein